MGKESHLNDDLLTWTDDSRAGFEADRIVVVVARVEDGRHGDVEVGALHAGQVSGPRHVQRLARRAELKLLE